jgi:hypothetical protein
MFALFGQLYPSKSSSSESLNPAFKTCKILIPFGLSNFNDLVFNNNQFILIKQWWLKKKKGFLIYLKNGNGTGFN